MKKEVIFGIFIVLLIGIVSATPYILFVDPTPADGTQTTGSSLTINSTIENMTTLNEFIFNWQGTNYSLYDEDLILMLNLNNNSNLGENDTLVYDSSRGGHNGSVVGGAEYISSGKYAGAYNFTGGQGVSISSHEDFNVDEFTISLWVKLRKKRVIDFNIGQHETCFIDEDNKLFCLGQNSYGQVGEGTTNLISNFIKISPNLNFSKVVVGQKHVCGLLINGSALCWGENGGYQFGNGVTTDSYTPTFVSGNHNFTNIFGGDYNTCGVLENLTIFCWGYGTSGQFGDGTTNNGVVPRILTPDFNFSMIAPGELHMCGLLQNGSVYCWGANNEGQLGIGNITNMNYPQYISGSLNFTFIDSGEDQTCGVLTNGSALCWGENIEGNMGTGDTITPITIPTFVDTSFLFSKIWLAKHYTCGNLTNGSYVCWGTNNQGGVYGDGTTEMSIVPKIVNWGIDFDKIYDSKFNSDRICAMKEGVPYCWGENSFGESGLGATGHPRTPIKFNFDGNEAFYKNKVGIGGSNSCMINDSGYLYCRGDGSYGGELGRNNLYNNYTVGRVYGDYNFSKVVLSNVHMCGLLQNGSALCWGYNDGGQIGNGSSGMNVLVPTYVSGNHTFRDINIGGTYSCGLLHNGSALCWGDNTYGQIGNGSSGIDVLIPIYVSGGHNFSIISIGSAHMCGILQNGSALCWGQNTYAQLGLGAGNNTQMNIPTYVSGNNVFKQISNGMRHTCGLLYNGSTLCWGYNNNGQIGNGSSGINAFVPTYVSGNYNFSYIDSLRLGGCGILQNGSLMCWGSNSNGELANINFELNEISTVPIVSAKGIVFDSFNYDYYFNMWGEAFSGQTLYVWGYNYFSQLGENALPPLVPTEIYLGDILGKSDASFKIGATMNASIRAFVNQRWLDIPANEGWNQVTFVYNGSKSILYLNGEKQIEQAQDLMLFPQDIDLKIGSNLTGQIDQILVWNRTLTDAEIEQVYLSSLQQKNHTAWEFYSTQTLSSVGTYTYSLFALDGTGTFNVLRSIVKYVVEEGGGNGPGTIVQPTYTIKEGKLKEGYTRWFRAKNEIKLEFGGQGSKILEILSVDKNKNIVKISVNSVEVEVVNGTTEKIDVNSDGFYDLELSLLDISDTGSSRLMFKEIYEEIPSDTEDAVKEEAKEEEGVVDEEEDVKDKKLSRTWVYFIFGGIVFIGFVVFFSLFRKKK